MTTYDLSKVQRVRAAIESSFGTDMTSDIATNFFDVRVCQHTEMMRDTLVGEDETIVQRNYQQNDVVISEVDGWNADLKCYWVSTGSALDATTSPTKTSQSKLLEVILGGYYAAQGSDVVASPSPTTTTFSVTTGHGSRFSVGQLVGVKISGVVYPALVTTISTDALTVWPALPSAPSTGDDVLNGQNIYFKDAPSGSINLLTELAADRNNIYLGLGGQGDFTLDLSRGALASWTSKLKGPRYKHDDEFTTPLTSGSTIAAATYDGSAPIHANIGGLHFGPTSSSTRTLIRHASITLGFAIENEEVPELSGIDGVGQWHRNTRGPMTMELVIPGAHETYHDAFLASTKYGALFWLGSTGGAVRAFAASTMQIIKAPEPAELGSMRAVKLSLRLQENSKSSSNATELSRSPFVMAGI